jgi:hypothetical protein
MFGKVARPWLIGLLMVSVAQSAHAQRGNSVVQFDGQTLDEMIAAYMKEHRVPGMTLRVVVWQEPDGTVWAGYHDPAELALLHHITDRPETIETLRAGLAAALAHATTPY